MAFKSYEEVVGPLTLTIRGKAYTLPDVSLADGVRIHQAEQQALSVADLVGIILGPVREEMIADGLPASAIDRVFYTGLADFKGGRDAAEKVWENGVPKEVLTAMQEAVNQAGTTPTAAATTTPPPASTSGTKTRTARTAGKKSSPTGR